MILKRFSRTTPTQLLLLILYTTSALAFSLVFDFRPRAVFSLGHFARGIAAAPLLISAVLLAHGILLAYGRFAHAQAIALERQLVERMPLTARIAAGLVHSCGEEVLLRIFLFSYVALYSLTLALFVNSIAVLMIYYRGPRRLSWSGVRVLEGTVAALIYYAQHSFLSLVVARALSYSILTLFLLSPGASSLISAPVKAWRKPHALIRKTLESISKRPHSARSV